MLFEQLLILLAICIFIFMIGIPFIKLLKLILPQKQDPLKEAKLRLEIAKKDLEAVKLNKETEKLYNQMYDESLQVHEEKDKLRV